MQGRRMLGAIGAAAVMTLALASCSSAAGGDGGEGGDQPQTVFRVAFNQNAEHPQAVALTELSEALEVFFYVS